MSSIACPSSGSSLSAPRWVPLVFELRKNQVLLTLAMCCEGPNCPTGAATLAIICSPFKIQNPSEPQNTHRSTPQILLQNRIQKKYEKYTKITQFRVFFVFFSVFRFWRRTWGVFRGVLWGLEGFCILYGGRMIRRQPRKFHVVKK